MKETHTPTLASGKTGIGGWRTGMKTEEVLNEDYVGLWWDNG